MLVLQSYYQEDLAAVVAAAEEAASGVERAAEEGEAAVGVIGEGRADLADLLDEREHELEPALEAEGLLALGAAELLERPRGGDGGEELLHQGLVRQLPPRRLGRRVCLWLRLRLRVAPGRLPRKDGPRQHRSVNALDGWCALNPPGKAMATEWQTNGRSSAAAVVGEEAFSRAHLNSRERGGGPSPQRLSIPSSQK